jgi:hypothetical protein
MGLEEEPPTTGARVTANNRRTSGFIGLSSCANSIDGEQVIRTNREEKHGDISDISCFHGTLKIGDSKTAGLSRI